MVNAIEPNPAQLHTQQFLLQDAAPAIVELIVGSIELLQSAVDGFGLAEPAGKTHHSCLLLLVGLAQLRCVANHQQMVHDSPAPAQSLPQLLHGRHQVAPAQGRALGLQAGLNELQFSFELREQPRDALAHRFRGDGLIVG